MKYEYFMSMSFPHSFGGKPASVCVCEREREREKENE